MKFMTRFLLIVMLASSFVIVSAKQIVYLPYIETVNLSKSYENSLTLLLKEEVEKNREFTVKIPQNSNDLGYRYQTRESIVKIASELGANYALIGLVVVKDKKVNVKFTMFDTQNSSLVWSDEVKSQPMEKLEMIIKKFAEGLGLDQKIVIEDERSNFVQYIDKTFTENVVLSFGPKLGATMPNINLLEKQPLMGVGLNFSYDIRTIIFEVNYDIYYNNTKLAQYNAGVLIPFFKGNSSPFIKFNVGNSSMTAKSKPVLDETTGKTVFKRDTSGGLVYMAGCGYTFNRYKETSFRIQGDYFHSSYKVNGNNPTGYIVSFSLLFAI